LITTLFEVHGHEIFFDGEFNGDPHPGNILLLPDGRLGIGLLSSISLGLSLIFY
jgi:aarF domain-containing kinase